MAESQIEYGFRLLTGRRPQTVEMSVLSKAFHRSLSDFQSDSDSATKLLKVGESIGEPTTDVPRLAALTVLAGTIMNLDETITKE